MLFVPQTAHHMRLFSVLLMILTLIVSACSDSGGGNASVTIPIEDEFNGQLSAQAEEEIALALQDFAEKQFKATVLINSTLFADTSRTHMDVIKARGNAAILAIDELIDASVAVMDLEEQYLTPILTANGASKIRLKKKPDLLHATRLIDLYMNDDAFYRKYKLSDIARKTGVSMTRLRMMMQQEVYEIETAGYIQEEEQYATAVKNMKTIRDTAVAAEGALATFATGGAAAGTLTTLQKGVAIVEKANAIISATEAGVNVINTAIGTDEIPPAVQTVFTVNKVVSYVLIPKALSAKDAGSVIALTGPTNDATDWYYNINADSNTVDVSKDPKNDTTKPIEYKERNEVVDDLLLPGDYQLPKNKLITPTKDNSGFSFVEDPTSEDDFVLDAVNMADLWDLPTATTDTMTWDTEGANPDATMEHVSSLGLDPDKHPLGIDPVLSSAALADDPAVVVTASPASGDASLIVTFNATLSDPVTESLTYEWFFGDGSSMESALANPDHTYDEAGTFKAIVYVKGAEMGTLMGSATVTVTEAQPTNSGGDQDSNWWISYDACVTPIGVSCSSNEVDPGVVMCNRNHLVLQVCTDMPDTYEEKGSCVDGNPMTYDECGRAADDCSASCVNEDYSQYQKVQVDNCSHYSTGRDLWCMEDPSMDDDYNLIGPYYVRGLYRCADETTIELVEACPCQYGEMTCWQPSPYPYK